ncbi:MAG: hypothetical protein JWN77_1918 [Frankiales bacterium]|nr:hypothetical protein [Frankiales bacterium]
MRGLRAGRAGAPGGAGLTVVALAVLVGAVSQAISGIGFSLVCGPFLVALLGAHEGIRLSVLLSLLLNVALLARLRREVDARGALLLLVPAALATPLWAVLVRSLPDRPSRAAAGAVVVLGALLLASGARWAAATGTAGAVGTGIVAALTNVVAGVAGPPVALWAENARWAAGRQRATLQAFFLGLNLVALPSLGPPHVGAPTLVACVVAMTVGVLLGVRLRVPERVARRVTLSLAGAGGMAVLVSAALR